VMVTNENEMKQIVNALNANVHRAPDTLLAALATVFEFDREMDTVGNDRDLSRDTDN